MEKVEKLQAALNEAEGLVATTEAKGAAAPGAEKKKAARARESLDSLRSKLARETEILEQAQKKAAITFAAAQKKAAAAAQKEEANRAMANGALLLFVDIRCRYQSRFDNSSDNSADIWERIVHEFKRKAAAEGFATSDYERAGR